jgi:hypothetical protein
MPPRIAMRLTEDLLSVAEQFSGESFKDWYPDMSYMVITVHDITEFTIKLMSEEEMLTVYTDDSTLEILN